MTNPPSHDAIVGLVFILLIGLAIVVGLILAVVPYWFICKKAGFPAALSLVMLIPFGALILPFILAFSEWPSLKKNNS